MDKLWAPWRHKYILTKKQRDCIFCKAKMNASANFVILKTKHSIAMLNIFPYNNGHVMVSPSKHIKEFSQLKDNEVVDLFKTLGKVKSLLDKVLKPHGYNIGLNLSLAAGAGIPGHLHLHIVPRWKGDTNFMPVLSGTKVISQSLAELHKKLKHAQSKSD